MKHIDRSAAIAASLALATAMLTPASAEWNDQLPSKAMATLPAGNTSISAIAPGDLDGDGVGDVVWTYGSGSIIDPEKPTDGPFLIHVYSGATGALVQRLDAYPGAQQLHPLPDETGDGVPEFLALFPALDVDEQVDRGAARIFDGSTREMLRMIPTPMAGGGLGFTVSRLADRNGDGVPEFLMGSVFEDAPTIWQVVSGATGESLLTVALEESDGPAPFAVGTPDLTGDGIADLLVAVSPGVRLIDGATGDSTRLFRTPAGADGYFGLFLIVVPDQDEDGEEDFVTYMPGADAWLAVFSTADGELIRSVPGVEGLGGLSLRTAVQGDYTGDGVGDAVIGVAPGKVVFLDGATLSASILNVEFTGTATNNPVILDSYGPASEGGGFSFFHLGSAPTSPHLVPDLKVLAAALPGDESDDSAYPDVFGIKPVGETRSATALLSAYGIGPVEFTGATVAPSPDFSVANAPPLGTLIAPGELLELELSHLGVREGTTTGSLTLDGLGTSSRTLGFQGRSAIARPRTANEITLFEPGEDAFTLTPGTPGFLYGLQPSTGVTRIVAGENWTAGTTLGPMTDAALSGTDQVLVVTNPEPQVLLAIDLKTSAVQPFGPPLDQAPVVERVHEIVRYDASRLVMRADVAGGRALLWVDAETGQRSLLSGGGVGDGVPLTDTTVGRRQLAAVPGGPLYVRQPLDLLYFRLVSVDPTSGDRQLVHQVPLSGASDNPFRKANAAILADIDGQVFAYAPEAALWRYAPAEPEGEFVPFSGDGAGSGPGEGIFAAVGISRDGRQMVGIELTLGALVWIDRHTGERRLVEYPAPLSGPMPPLESSLRWRAILFDIPPEGMLLR